MHVYPLIVGQYSKRMKGESLSGSDLECVLNLKCSGVKNVHIKGSSFYKTSRRKKSSFSVQINWFTLDHRRLIITPPLFNHCLNLQGDLIWMA